MKDLKTQPSENKPVFFLSVIATILILVFGFYYIYNRNQAHQSGGYVSDFDQLIEGFVVVTGGESLSNTENIFSETGKVVGVSYTTATSTDMASVVNNAEAYMLTQKWLIKTSESTNDGQGSQGYAVVALNPKTTESILISIDNNIYGQGYTVSVIHN